MQVSATKPVYVMYPNYTLPDLSFLKKHATELDLKNVFLWPQKFSPSPTTEHACVFSRKEPCEEVKKQKRPYSCPDLETLKNRGELTIAKFTELPKKVRRIMFIITVFSAKPLIILTSVL